MKKNLRFALLLIMIVVMLAVTAFMTSAAGEPFTVQDASATVKGNYATFEEALAAVDETNNVILVNAATTVAGDVTIGKAVTIDCASPEALPTFEGKVTIAANAVTLNNGIYNGGLHVAESANLTIKDGQFTKEVDGTNVYSFASNAKMTIDGGHFKGNFYVNCSGDLLTINGGTFTASGADRKKGGVIHLYDGGAEVVINGGTFTKAAPGASNSALIFVDTGKLTIAGEPEFLSEGGPILTGNSTCDVTVKSGTFTANSDYAAFLVDAANAKFVFENGTYKQNGSGYLISRNNGFLTIKDGTYYAAGTLMAQGGTMEGQTTIIDGGTFEAGGEYVFATGNAPHDKTFTINGGTFKGADTVFKGTGIQYIINDGVFTGTNSIFYANDNDYGSKVTINGGTFATESADGIMFRYRAADAGRASSGTENPWVITGGTFNAAGSLLQFGMVKTYETKFAISGGTFTVGADHMFNIYSQEAASALEISGGTFTFAPAEVTPTTALIVAHAGDGLIPGATVRITGGEFSLSAPLLCLADPFLGGVFSNVEIAGGTFNMNGTSPLIGYTALPIPEPVVPEATPENPNPEPIPNPDPVAGHVVAVNITDGVFNYTGSGAEMILVNVDTLGINLKIQGGTYNIATARLLTYKGTTADSAIRINGGSISSNADAVVYFGASPAKLSIGGSAELILAENSKGAATDAVVIVECEAEAVANLTIDGGTLVDDRAGNDQVIRNNSKNAITFEGGKLYSKAEQAYFYQMVGNEGASVAMTAASPKEEYKGTQYFLKDYTPIDLPVEDHIEVLGADGASLGKFDNFAAAQAVVPVGGTIKLFADAPIGIADWVMNGEYTFDGCGFSIIVDREGLAVGKAPIQIAGGKITIKNVTIVEKVKDDLKICDTALSVMAGTVVLDTVSTDGFNTAVALQGPAALTLKGECNMGASTVDGNGSTILFKCEPASVGGKLTIDAGTYASYGIVVLANGADVVLNDGSFTSKGNSVLSHSIVYSDSDVAVSNTVINNGKYVVFSTGAKEPSAIVYYKGKGAAANYDATVGVVSVNGGTFDVSGSSSYIFVDELVQTLTEGGQLAFNIRGGSAVVGMGGNGIRFAAGEGFAFNIYNIAISMEGGNRTFDLSPAVGGAFTVYDANVKGGEKGDIFYVYKGKMDLLVKGGTFVGGDNWLYTQSKSTLVIDGGKFVDSSTKGRSIWCGNGSIGGHIIINGGEFLQSQDCYLMNAAGAAITINGGTFSCGGRLISMHDGDTVSTVIINGGTFNCSGYQGLIEYSAGKDDDTPDGALTINDGVFNYTGRSEMFRFSTDASTALININGGTYTSTQVRIIYVKDGSDTTTYNINGGKFSTDANRLMYFNKFNGQFNIHGGSFTLNETPEGLMSTAQDAVIYMFCRGASHLNIDGGTFIDNRTGNDGIICNLTDNVIGLNGGTFLSHEKQSHFLYAENNNAIVMEDDLQPTLVDGQKYYVLNIVPSNVEGFTAPSMEAVKGFRANADSMGIRFTSYISRQVAEIAKGFVEAAEGNTISYGTIIMPLENFAKLTVSAGEYHAAIDAYVKAQNIADASTFYADVAATEKGIVKNTNGSMYINAALVNIKNENKAKDFIGIAYIKATQASGETQYIYSSMGDSGFAANMGDIAAKALADVHDKREVVEEVKSYGYPSIMQEGKFSRLTEAQQNALKAYLPAA